MFYHSAEVDEDLQCSFCKEKFTDVIKLMPSCGESICGECFDELQTGLDAAREFTCKACQDTHVMPLDGLPDNRGLCRLIKKRKIEKPISDQAKELRQELANLKGHLATLQAFDPQEHINLHCDNLDSQVTEAFESAIAQLQKLQQETLKQIQDYRRLCLTSSLAKSHNESKRDGTPSRVVQEKLRVLTREITELATKWDDYFSLPQTLATEGDIHAALQDSNRFDKMLGSLRSSMISQLFEGKAMTFRPNLSIYEDESKLKEVFNLRLEVEPIKACQVQSTSSCTLTGHTMKVFQVIPISIGRLASCSMDKTIKVWNTRDGVELFELKGHADWVTCLAMLPNGYLASGSQDSTIEVWDLNERKVIRTLEGHTRSVCWLHVLKNGNLASYSADDTIRIWSPYRDTGNLLMTMTGHSSQKWITSFSILNTDFLVTCSKDVERKEECVMRVWNPSDGQLVKAVSTGHVDFLAILALSNDLVAIGFANGTIKLIDWTEDAKSRIKEKAHTSSVSAFAQLSNGHLLSAGHDASPNSFPIKMWDLSDFTLLQTITTGHTDFVISLSLSPEESHFASASHDSTIKLWLITSNAV